MKWWNLNTEFRLNFLRHLKNKIETIITRPVNCASRNFLQKTWTYSAQGNLKGLLVTYYWIRFENIASILHDPNITYKEYTIEVFTKDLPVKQHFK